jgi:hypothetical protein
LPIRLDSGAPPLKRLPALRFAGDEGWRRSLDELRHTQQELGRDSHVASIDPYVEEVLLDGAHEVVEELS